MMHRYQWQKGMSTRRDFLGMSVFAAAGFSCYGCRTANAAAWQGWKKGHFQVHFLYTGAGECMFLIFPDGTTAMIDCGGFDAAKRGKLALPILPNGERHAGEWAWRVPPSRIRAMRTTQFVEIGENCGCRLRERYSTKSMFA